MQTRRDHHGPEELILPKKAKSRASATEKIAGDTDCVNFGIFEILISGVVTL